MRRELISPYIKDSPDPGLIQTADQGRVIEFQMLGGLHHQNVRIAAWQEKLDLSGGIRLLLREYQFAMEKFVSGALTLRIALASQCARRSDSKRSSTYRVNVHHRVHRHAHHRVDRHAQHRVHRRVDPSGRDGARRCVPGYGLRGELDDSRHGDLVRVTGDGHDRA